VNPDDLSPLADAEADQIAATLRDLTPGQRLGLIRACLVRLSNRGLALAENGHPTMGGSIVALAGIAGQATDDLLPTVGEFQNADHVLAAYADAARRVRTAARHHEERDQ